VLSTASPAFKSLVDATRAAKGADFSICDVDIPSKVG
jgi:peptidylprolyl isomerase